MGGGLAQGDFTWFEQGYYTTDTSQGLPAPGSTITSMSQADHSYALTPSYTANDAVIISINVPSATITPTAPLTGCSGLSLLGSAGHGPVVVNYTVHHADNTTEMGSLSIPDWYGPGTAPEVMAVGCRVDALGLSFQFSTPANGFSSNAPYLFSFDIPVTNTTSAVTSLDLTYVSGGVACLLGLSSSTGSGYSPVAMTGYNADAIVEAGAQTHGSGSVADVVNQTNGAVSVTESGQLFVGNAGTAIYKLSGGSIAAGNGLMVGRTGGTGVLTKGGSQSLTLETTNDYSGGTTLTGGAIYVGTDGALAVGQSSSMPAPWPVIAPRIAPWPTRLRKMPTPVSFLAILCRTAH